jgi:fructosamine-3-kinase
MESVTKSKIPNSAILELTKNTFGSSADLVSIEELTDGYFNTAYLVTLKDGFKSILKVAPLKSVRLMRYEKDLMRAEVETLNLIKTNTKAPVPKVYDYVPKSNIIENELFFMEYIDGVPFNKIKEKLSSEDNAYINKQVGMHTKQINSIKGDCYGYISQKDKQFKTWAEAFTLFIDELLEDGQEANIELPMSYSDIKQVVKNKTHILNQITQPTLLHKDLWLGNIFVNPDNLEVTGIIDCERAVWGDPMMEFVCGFLEDNEAFNMGYERNKAVSLDDKYRKSLYSIYLYLIMTIECRYRFYPTDDQEKWAWKSLENELKIIENL